MSKKRSNDKPLKIEASFENALKALSKVNKKEVEDKKAKTGKGSNDKAK